MSSRASRTQGQQQQQQPAMFTMPCVSRSTASASRMRPDNSMPRQQRSSGVQGGPHSEPLRPQPSYPAPSTIMPDDSASGLGSPDVFTRETQRNTKPVNKYLYNVPSEDPAPGHRVASKQMPRDIPQTIPYSFIDVLRASEIQYAPSSFRPTPQSNMSENGTGNPERVAQSQRSGPTEANYQYSPSLSGPYAPSNIRNTTAPSTARLANQPPYGLAQSSMGRTATRSGIGMSTGAISRNQGMANSRGLPLSLNGPRLSSGIDISVPPNTQMHFHYNQVDNRQRHVSNNAPQNVVTNNNQTYNTDNSNHHNTHAPQTNTYNTQATNVGNSHTQVSQKGKTAHRAVASNSTRPPRESIVIRDRLFKPPHRLSATQKHVPNDRPSTAVDTSGRTFVRARSIPRVRIVPATEECDGRTPEVTSEEDRFWW